MQLHFALGTAEEKAFIDKFKTAFEAGDKATLGSFLYTKGARPREIKNMKTGLTHAAGEKISKIELVDFNADDAKELNEFLAKRGKQVSLKPTKILLYGCTSLVGVQWVDLALKDGKFVIPVPVPVK